MIITPRRRSAGLSSVKARLFQQEFFLILMLWKNGYAFAQVWPVAIGIFVDLPILAYACLKLYDEPIRRWLGNSHNNIKSKPMKRFWHNIKLWVTRSYARGVWMPLLCAVGICLLALGLILLADLVVWMFTCEPVSIGRIIELMMDPGSFSANEKPSTWFQLCIALIGAVVFTALLITTISNMFSNRAEAYRNGETEVDLKDHTLILGTNDIFYNSLNFLLDHKGDKVILTSVKATEVRTRIASYVGSEKADEFIILTGDRRFVKNLERASYKSAQNIYILGEENESDHDAANISCLQELSKITGVIVLKECILEIDNPDVLTLLLQTKLPMKGARIFNRNELLASGLLIGDANGLRLPYLTKDDDRRQHLIVIGSSALSTEIAKLYLKLAHYPNFESKKIKSKLTVIDNEACLNLGRQSNLKEVCHIRELWRDTTWTDSFNAKEYDDLLDFEIYHIKGNVLDDHVRMALKDICDDNDNVSIVISSNDTDRNFRDGINLPDFIYEADYQVFVYQPVTGLVIDKKNLPYYYDNLNQFGLKSSLEDIYDRHRTELIRAISYADLMIGSIKPDTKYSDKEPDEHFMISDLGIQRTMINQAQYLQYVMSVKEGDLELDESVLRCMHYSWMTNKLTDVYKMMPRQLWDTYNRKLSNPSDKDARIGLVGCRRLSHQLYDLTSYEKCRETVREYDTRSLLHIRDYIRNHTIYSARH